MLDLIHQCNCSTSLVCLPVLLLCYLPVSLHCRVTTVIHSHSCLRVHGAEEWETRCAAARRAEITLTSMQGNKLPLCIFFYKFRESRQVGDTVCQR